MSGLEDDFGGQVEFVTLDWDDKSLNDIRGQLGITDRTQYVLAEAGGEVVKRWYGILNEAQLKTELEAFLKG